MSEELEQIEQLLFENENNKALELILNISKRKDLTDEEKTVCILYESRIKFNLGEGEQAIKEADRIWPTIQKLKDPFLILDYLNLKTLASWILGDLDSGINAFKENLDSVTKFQSKIPMSKERIFKSKRSELLRNGGILYWYKGNLDAALTYHSQSLAIGEDISNELSILNSLNNIGLVYQSKGNIDKAIEYYSRALEISMKLDLKHRISTNLSNLGNVYTLIGDLDKALEILQKSLEIRKQLGNKINIAASLINVGVTYQLKGDLDQALENYEECLHISKEVDSKSNLALALNNIGNIYELKGDPKLALSYFEKSLKLFSELGIKEKIALLYSNIGSIYRLIGNTEVAIENFNQSLSIYEELGNELSSAMVLFELIQEVIVENDHELVQEYLKKLDQIYKTTNIRSIEQRHKLANALVLKTSNQTRNQAKALVLFEQVIEAEIVDHSLTVKAMVNLCDLLIKELTQTAEVELLTEIRDLVGKLQEIAKEQSSDSILAEIYRLRALLCLAELDLKEARNLLQKGLILAEEKSLERIASDIRGEQRDLEEQIKLWEELQERKAPLEETLKYVKIERSAKHLQHEETVTYKKLFSLKI